MFASKDPSRIPTQGQQIRVLGLNVSSPSVSSSTTLDDSGLSFSPGWSHLNAQDPSGNVVLNQTEADAISSRLDAFSNSTASWTDFDGSSVAITFDGTSVALRAPLGWASSGRFLPLLDGVALPEIDTTVNLADPSQDAATTLVAQIVWLQTGLSPGQHNLTLTNIAREGGSKLIIDALEVATASSPA